MSKLRLKNGSTVTSVGPPAPPSYPCVLPGFPWYPKPPPSGRVHCSFCSRITRSTRRWCSPWTELWIVLCRRCQKQVAERGQSQ